MIAHILREILEQLFECLSMVELIEQFPSPNVYYLVSNIEPEFWFGACLVHEEHHNCSAITAL
jgi:hypothetical protein